MHAHMTTHHACMVMHAATGMRGGTCTARTARTCTSSMCMHVGHVRQWWGSQTSERLTRRRVSSAVQGSASELNRRSPLIVRGHILTETAPRGRCPRPPPRPPSSSAVAPQQSLLWLLHPLHPLVTALCALSPGSRPRPEVKGPGGSRARTPEGCWTLISRTPGRALQETRPVIFMCGIAVALASAHVYPRGKTGSTSGTGLIYRGPSENGALRAALHFGRRGADGNVRNIANPQSTLRPRDGCL